MDVATLGVRIVGTGIKETVGDLGNLAGAAGRAEQATRRFERVQTEGTLAAKAARDAIREQAAAFQAAQTAQVAAVQSTEQVAVGTQRATVSMARFQNAVNNLGLAAVGVQGPMGKIVETIAILGIGGGLVTGVLAGIAAIGAAFRYLNKDIDAAHKAYTDYMDSLRRATPLAIVGAELDVARSKLAETERLAATPSGSLAVRAGQVERERQAVTDLTRQYNELYQSLQTVSRGEAAEKFASPTATKNLKEFNDALADAVKLSTEYAKVIRLFPDRNAQTGGDPFASAQAGLVNAANAGGRSWAMIGVGGEPGRNAAENAEKVAESWRDASQSVANVVVLLGTANDATLRMLGNAVGFVGQLESAAAELKQFGGLSLTSGLGLFAAGAGLLSSVFGLGGDSPEEIRRREVLQKNTEAIDKLTREIGGFGLLGGMGANTVSGVQRALNSLLNGGAGAIGSQGAGLLIQRSLAAQGLSMADLRSVAEGLGISFAHAIPSVEELRQVMEAIAAADLTQIRQTFTGQLDLLRREFELFDISEPTEQLRRYLDLIMRSDVGAPGFAQQFMQFDLTTAQGRAQAELFLQEQFRRFNQSPEGGGFTLEELGGLSPEQFMDLLLTFEGLLDDMNTSLAGAGDALRTFADALRLDTTLTTLTPMQQYAEARRQYESVLALAQGGDAAAAAQLPAVARQFLEASRAVNASGPQYAADFARVLRETEALADALGSQTDIWVSIDERANITAENTTAMLEEQRVTVAVLQEGLTSLVDTQRSTRVALDDLILAVRRGFETASLN